MCYTYDELSRVTKRTTMTLDGTVLAEETYSHDAAGNIVGDTENTSYAYDKNNRLVFFDGKAVTYDLDGNMLSDGKTDFVYDSSNRLLSTDGISYTYNAENVRIRKKSGDKETLYTYNTNCRLSQLLWVREGETVTKYVYGRGLIGEEVQGYFSTYHFDLRGSTVAVTDECGCIADTFIYDTYGKLISGTGTSNVIFGYNGRDGVVTDENGLIYMRARYYSPEMKRFINADIVAGKISNAVTLNRFAYANGNPVSFVDPFGLSAWDDIASAGNIVINVFENKWGTVCEGISAFCNNAGEAANAVIEGNLAEWGVDKFKELTREGKLDHTIDKWIGASKDKNGIYHIDQSYWQSFHFIGYNDLYDKIFDHVVGMTGYTVNNKKFQFTTKDGTDYVIWMWKGDYINLGSGAEVGIYKESIIPGHWLTGKELSMPMSLKLQEIDSEKVLFDYKPSEKQWWINGFDPSNQNAYESNLALTVTIDFSNNSDIYTALKETWGESDWKFDDMQATYTWRNK